MRTKKIVMPKTGLLGLGCIISALFLSPPLVVAQKQQPPTQGNPQLYIVKPPGGKAGTTVQISVTGINLNEPQGLLFSDPGIQSELVREPTQSAAKPTEPAKKADGKRQPPAMAGQTASHQFKITIPPNTPLGAHDIRIITKNGVTNPRAFVIGDLAEVDEKEPNNDVPQAQRVDLNTTINGAITSPTDVDYFVFTGKKAERVVVSCLTSSIDSRLNPAVEMFDRAGKMLAFNRNYQSTDALLDATLPENGDYFIRVHDFTYTQGTAEHFYRLSIGTMPWIDAVFPPTVEPGKATQVTVFGRNLPGGILDPSAVVDGRVLEKIAVTLNPPDNPEAAASLAFRGHLAPQASMLDGFEYRIRNASGTSNPFLITFARAPVVLDNGANDSPQAAQEIVVPCEIAGRIETKDDRDWYTFAAKKGAVYSIEVFGDRLGSAIDLYWSLHDAASKKTIVELDDNPDIMNPIQFFTRTEDPPRYRFAVPQDGKYQLMVATREASIQAGPRDLYKVRITPEEPDFRLVVMPQAPNMPDACIVRQNGRLYYTVYAWRLDGFTDGIALTAEGLPPGVTCPPQTIGPNLREATLVISADKDAAVWTGPIVVKGTATINGKPVVREARAATITWPTPQQQNIAAISRLDRQLVLAVREHAPFNLTTGIDKATASAGDKVTIPVKLQRLAADFKLPVQVTVVNAPGEQGQRRGNRVQPTVIAPDKEDANIVVDIPAKMTPGTYTIVLRGETQISNPRQPRPRPGDVNMIQASAPVLLTIQSKK
jgi:hypothetical protein